MLVNIINSGVFIGGTVRCPPPFGPTLKIFYRRLYMKRCVFAIFQQELQNLTMFDGLMFVEEEYRSLKPTPERFTSLRKWSRDAVFDEMASTCWAHFRSLATCTPSNLNVVTRSTGAPLSMTDTGGSLRSESISIFLVWRPFSPSHRAARRWNASRRSSYSACRSPTT